MNDTSESDSNAESPRRRGSVRWLIAGLVMLALIAISLEVVLLTRTVSPSRAFSSVSPAGDVVASFRADYQTGRPKAGWRYLWNARGPLGDASQYVELQWRDLPLGEKGVNSYVSDPNAPFPNPAPARFLRISSEGGHPGHGPYQTKVADERFAIYAFTIPARGHYWLTNSLIARSAGGKNGTIHVQVLVNDNETGHDVTCRSRAGVSFDRELGMLNEGDVMYVAVGPGEVDAEDGFTIDFSIMR